MSQPTYLQQVQNLSHYIREFSRGLHEDTLLKPVAGGHHPYAIQSQLSEQWIGASAAPLTVRLETDAIVRRLHEADRAELPQMREEFAGMVRSLEGTERWIEKAYYNQSAGVVGPDVKAAIPSLQRAVAAIDRTLDAK